MRILTVTNLYPPDVIGGYELGCRQMTERLRERGHEVLVLTSHPRKPVPAAPGVRRELRFALSTEPVDSPNVGSLLRTIEEFQPDVVYLWNLYLLGTVGLAGALAYLQTPVVWHLMDAVPRSGTTWRQRPIGSAARTLSRRLRAHYLACSQRLLDEIGDIGFAFGDRARVIPNWVDADERERSYFPHTGDELRMVYAGQLSEHKGIDIIIDAAAQLAGSGHSGFSIDLFGAGDRRHFERMVLERRLGDRVRVRGSLPQAEIVERLWNYDVFVFPTWAREPFAFAPLEAAVRGCVQLISADSGNAEWFVDGVHCLKAARNATAFATAMSSILDGGVDLEPIARRASATIRASFSLDNVVAEVERALNDAIELPATRPGTLDDAYHLARFAERLALELSERG